jgi:hypothetical protein
VPVAATNRSGESHAARISLGSTASHVSHNASATSEATAHHHAPVSVVPRSGANCHSSSVTPIAHNAAKTTVGHGAIASAVRVVVSSTIFTACIIVTSGPRAINSHVE